MRTFPPAVADDRGVVLSRSPRLLDLVHDAIIVRDLTTGTVCYWNRGATVLYGWRADEVRDRDPMQLLRTESAPPPDEITTEVLRRGLWEGTLRQTTRDGDSRTVASRWALRDDQRGRAIVQIDRDITAQIRDVASTALAAARAAEVRRLGELAALKADFTAMVAHELGGPVAAISRLADALALAGRDPAAQVRMIAAIQAEAALLTTLTADVRQAAAAERDDFAVHPQPTPLAPLLADAHAHARTLPGDHPARLADHTPPGTRVLADAQRIGQVLRNLLANAAKFSPAGAPIELRAEPSQGERAIRLAVADRGHGIEQADLRRILEKFGRGRDPSGCRTPGLGLGLYLSRRIVQAHGGDFDIASSPGVGSTFAFYLERD